MNLPLILASTSPYRRALIARLNYPFSVEDPQLDETPFKTQGLAPAALAQRLAREKALAVARRHPHALVIGGDQVAAFKDSILSKPGTVEVAVAQLLRLQGQTHQLFTALHLLGPGIDRPILEVTTLKMREMDFNQARRYVELDRPLDCAGSYKLEASGIKLFTEISGGDHDAIVGVPLMTLQSELTQLGFSLF
ncbi:MAG: Maf family protein [Bacteriovoracia bacterium]